MNKTITFAIMIASVASFAVAAAAVMVPLSAHADQPQYCYTSGGQLHCFSSKQQCEKAKPGEGAGQCKVNRS